MAKVPKTLGARADRLYAIKLEKKKLRDSIAKLDTERIAIEESIIQDLPKSQAEGVTGKVANVRIVKKDVPTVKDRETFLKYVSRTKAWDLLPRSVNNKAIEERWNDKKKVPGIGVFTALKISLTKK